MSRENKISININAQRTTQHWCCFISQQAKCPYFIWPSLSRWLSGVRRDNTHIQHILLTGSSYKRFQWKKSNVLEKAHFPLTLNCDLKFIRGFISILSETVTGEWRTKHWCAEFFFFHEIPICFSNIFHLIVCTCLLCMQVSADCCKCVF